MTTPPNIPPQWEYPAPPPQQPQPARFTIHYGFALLAIFSLLGAVIPTIIMFSAAGSVADGTESGHAAAGIGSGFGVMWLLWGGMWTLIWAAFAINHTLKERRRS